MEQTDKYRELVRMIERVKKMPRHLTEVKFQAMPHIPKEFRNGHKLPPAAYFAMEVFTLMDVLKLVEDYRQHLGLELDEKVKSGIDKE